MYLLLQFIGNKVPCTTQKCGNFLLVCVAHFILTVSGRESRQNMSGPKTTVAIFPRYVYADVSLLGNINIFHLTRGYLTAEICPRLYEPA